MVPPSPPPPPGGPSTPPGYAELLAVRALPDGSDVEARCVDLLDRLRETLDVPAAAAYAREPVGLTCLASVGGEAPERLDVLPHDPLQHELLQHGLLPHGAAPSDGPGAARLTDVPAGLFPGLAVYAHPIPCADGPGGVLLVGRAPDGDVASAEHQMFTTATSCRLGVMLERRARRLAEERRSSEAQRLHDAQKLQAMGSMVRGVAHDLNNLLTVVLGQIQLAGDAAPDEPDVQSATGRALDAVKVAAAIAEQLLTVARERASEPQVTDWNAVLRRLDRLLATMIGRKRALKLDLDDTISPVRADPALLAQIVLNLTLNARDALPAHGSVGITTFERKAAPNARTNVVLRVTDDGVGMDEQVRARIFEPLFTTKPRGEGTGLGLTTVVRIVESCGGMVRVDSAPGHGTTFDIELPAADKPAEEKSAAD